MGAAWRLGLALIQQAGRPPPCDPNSVPSELRCGYVRDHAEVCWPEGGLSRYLEVHECFFGAQWRWASVLLLLATLLVAFALLLTAAERFFCPALEYIADRLKLPPAVAGATLLSFGNGAPDVFTQLAAVKQMDLSTIGMALSEPVGGGLFTSNIVLGLVVLLSTRSHQVKVQKGFIMKDLGFYLFALAWILIAISDSKVEWYEATFLALSYVFYVALTAWLARSDDPVVLDVERHEIPPEDLLGVNLASLDSEFFDDSHHGRALFNTLISEPLLRVGEEDEEEGGAHGEGAQSHGGLLAVAASRAAQQRQQQQGERDSGHTPPENGSGGPEAKVAAEVWGHEAAALAGAAAAAPAPPSVGSTPRWSAGGTPRPRGAPHVPVRSLKRQLQQPFMLLMKWTMPKVGMSPKHLYPRHKAVMLPLTVPLLLLALFPAYWPRVGWEGLVWGLFCGTLGSVMVWALYPRDSIPTGRLKGVFAVLSFALSMVWLKLCADSLVKICVLLGTIFGIPPQILGATVLAWGNSMPDLANNLALARDGYPTMAITACFASPLFTLLVGTSSAMAYGAIAAGGVLDVPFDKMLGVMYGFAIANLAKYCLVIPLVHRWVLGRGLAVVALSFYAVYTLVYCLAVADVI